MSTRIAGMLVVALATAVAVHHYTTTPTRWTNPDSVFYQARMLDLRGDDTAPATV